MNKKSIGFSYLLPLILGVLLLVIFSNMFLNNSGKSSSQVDNVYNLFEEKEVNSDFIFEDNCKYKKKINDIDELEEEFLKGVENLSSKYNGVSSDDFLTIFSLETIKTFSPCILNPHNKAIGLIQFTGETLKELDVSFDEMSVMTRTEQLKYVDKYLIRYKSDIKDLTSLYLAIFLPSIIEESSNDNFIIPQKYYKQNIALDENNDGEIKISEINYYLEEYKFS